MENSGTVRVLVVDDEKIILDFFKRLLSGIKDVEVYLADSGSRAIEEMKKQGFDLVFLDIRMPGLDGLRTYTTLKKMDLGLNCVFMTGYTVEERFLNKVAMPGTTCLKKPFDDIRMIKEMVEKIAAEKRASGGVKKEIREVKDVKEQRSFARPKIALDVAYRIRTGGKGEGKTVTKNISPAGIRFSIKEELSPGAAVDLVITAPGKEHVCRASSEVVWVKPDSGKSGYYDMAVQFTSINLDDFARVVFSLEE